MFNKYVSLGRQFGLSRYKLLFCYCVTNVINLGVWHHAAKGSHMCWWGRLCLLLIQDFYFNIYHYFLNGTNTIFCLPRIKEFSLRILIHIWYFVKEDNCRHWSLDINFSVPKTVLSNTVVLRETRPVSE